MSYSSCSVCSILKSRSHSTVSTHVCNDVVEAHCYSVHPTHVRTYVVTMSSAHARLLRLALTVNVLHISLPQFPRFDWLDAAEQPGQFLTNDNNTTKTSCTKRADHTHIHCECMYTKIAMFGHKGMLWMYQYLTDTIKGSHRNDITDSQNVHCHTLRLLTTYKKCAHFVSFTLLLQLHKGRHI